MKCCILSILFMEIINEIDSAQCFTKFNIKSVCEINYGNSMADIWRRSSADCAFSCSEIPTCLSFFFLQRTGICRQNTGILTNFSVGCSNLQMYAEKDLTNDCILASQPTTPVASSSVYPTTSSAISASSTTEDASGPSTTGFTSVFTSTYESSFASNSSTDTGITFTEASSSTAETSTQSISTTTGIGQPESWQYMQYPYFFMSDPCATDLECGHLANAECVISICVCVMGYVFDWTSQNCVPSCSSYGHSYQVNYKSSLFELNIIEYPNMDEFQCLQACTDETTFVCKSVEYASKKTNCFLSNETALTQPTAVRNTLSLNLYHRDCLFL